MKRENPPSTGANKASSSPGLILDSASVWKKSQKRLTAVVSAPASQNWTRYIDSRLKQFGSR